jgi:uncharacterized protein
LCLNVGFLLHQTVGYNRTFEFDLPSVQVSDDLDVSDLQGELRLTRTAQGLYATGSMTGTTRAECGRCLTPFDQRLAIAFDDLFVYPPSKANEEMMAIPETGLLDLTPLTREYMLLDFPIRPLCRPDCRGLCPECGANRNETECDHDSPTTDPRLAGLRALLDDPA